MSEIKIAKNGYSYTKVESGKWRLTHHLVAEVKFARHVDSSQERVVFLDKDRTNLDPDNIDIVPIQNSKQRRIIVLKERIRQLQEELTHLEKSS